MPQSGKDLVGVSCVAAYVVAAASLVLMSQSCTAKDSTIATQQGTIKVETLTKGLDHPWGLAFLPDGRMLVTERPGRLRIVDKDGNASAPLKGVPQVFAKGQGGLLDVALDPNFATNGLVYLSYAEPGDDGKAGTAVARGKLGDNGLDHVQVIFRQYPKVDGGNHFGSRLVFSPDGKLFVTLGERFTFDPAQDLATHLGKIVRINPDGSVPADNPFVGQEGKLPEIWSYGHRNPQGAAINPESGKLWETEFGPWGGDELNIPEAGKNYGWPVVSWGSHYTGMPIPKPPTHPEFPDPIDHWNPVISPCSERRAVTATTTVLCSLFCPTYVHSRSSRSSSAARRTRTSNPEIGRLNSSDSSRLWPPISCARCRSSSDRCPIISSAQ